MIQANCRSRFTAEDFSYIVRILSQTPESAISLVDLLADNDTRDSILDHERLRDAVLGGLGNLAISPQLYFYVLTRAVLKDTALKDRMISDYLASLLSAFAKSSQMDSPCGGGGTTYLSDLMLALRNADQYQTFQIRAHVGNYALFISGILHENVRRRNERGAPNVRYYEDMGRINFKVAADHSLARKCELTSIFHDLADGFHEARLALNRLADQYINLGDDHYLPRLSL